MENQKITPCLWFNGKVQEALDLYTSLFKNSSIKTIARYPKGSMGEEGDIMTAIFELNGQNFMILNGGPQFPHSEAVSFSVDCETQEEVDELWEKLSEGGAKSRCGWLKDQFGISWQIIPSALGEVMKNADAATAKRVMDEVMKMDKLDAARIRKAAESVE